MLNNYYQQELSRLKEIATEFAKENPAIAPMLGEHSTDPDVERLLESVAFLTGSVRERIDDEFPEIIHNFIRQVWPHYLRPVPSATIIAFSIGKQGETGSIPAEGYVESIPVDGTRCKFKTCYDVDVHPVEITGVQYHESTGQRPVISIKFQMQNITAEQWGVERLRLYLGGGFKRGSDMNYVLSNYLHRILISTPENQEACVLDKFHLQPVGFSEEEALLPYPSNSFIGYRLIQEYFHMPEKFLFWDLSGWEKWTDRSGTTQFEVKLELTSDPDIGYFKVDSDSFVLSATPAVNIFPHPAAPISVEHKQTEYPVRPGGKNAANHQIYSIEEVSGVVKGLGETQYFQPFHGFNISESNFVYNEKIRKSPVHDRVDFSISLAYPPGFNTTDLKTLSADILCTNGNLPESLGPGEITIPTYSTPDFVRPENLIKPTTAVLPPLGSNMLWRLVSLLTVNTSSLSRPENLKSLLKLHLMREGNWDKKRVLANENRVEGIRELESRNVQRLVKGSMMWGLEINMGVSLNHFAGPGDLYLFGMIIDHFLGRFASMNNFTKLLIKETETGETFVWPERIGNMQII